MPKRSISNPGMVKSCSIIFACLLVGEVTVYLTGIPLPSSIIGMLLLTCLLAFNIIRLSWVKPMTDLLIRNLAFFYIPAGVGIMTYLHVLRNEWLSVGVSAIASMFIVMAVVGYTYQKFRKKDKV